MHSYSGLYSLHIPSPYSQQLDRYSSSAFVQRKAMRMMLLSQELSYQPNYTNQFVFMRSIWLQGIKGNAMAVMYGLGT